MSTACAPSNPYSPQIDEWIQDEIARVHLKSAQLACVYISSSEEIGSGVMIEGSGMVLTAAHAAGEIGEQRTVELIDGQSFIGCTTHVSSTHDLALVKLQNAAGPFPIATIASTPLRKGQSCLAIGQPYFERAAKRKNFQRQRVELGKIITVPQDPLYEEEDQRGILFHSCNTSAGHSGAPLLNMNGEICALHVTCDAHQQSAVTLEAIHKFIKETKLRCKFADATPSNGTSSSTASSASAASSSIAASSSFSIAAASVSATSASASASSSSHLSHPLSYHMFGPSEIPILHFRLLSWFDAHRRLLPWRGDPPAAVALAASSTNAASAANSAFGAREKKARADEKQSKIDSKSSVLNFFKKLPSPNGTAVASTAATTAASSNVTVTAPAAASISTPRLPVSAYGVWVSEIMLQQTRVETVIDYYTRWMNRFPTVQSLAAATIEEVNSMWAGLGFYRRAKFLHEGAKDVVNKHNGIMPNTIEGLKSIKGIGPYTAGAIGSIAFNLPTPLVDGNVIRVLSRFRAMEIDPKDKKIEPCMWKLAEQIVHTTRPGDFNQALMELGATVCTPLAPKCEECPIKNVCKAYNEVHQQRRPCIQIDMFLNKNNVETANASEAAVAPMVIDIESMCSPSSASTAATAKSKNKAAINPFACPTDACTFCAPRSQPPTSVTSYPLKASKKAPLEQQVAVCILRRSPMKEDGEEVSSSSNMRDNDLFLLVRRPNEGLLAGQLEFPSVIMPSVTSVPPNASAAKKKTGALEDEAKRRSALEEFLATQFDTPLSTLITALRHTSASLGRISHIFSHRIHHMHVISAQLVLNASLSHLAADRMVPHESSSGASTSTSIVVKKRGAAKSVEKKKGSAASAAASSKRSKLDQRKSKHESDECESDEEEEEEVEENAVIDEANTSALRSLRWVTLAELREDPSSSTGSALALSTGQRKIVQLILDQSAASGNGSTKPKGKGGKLVKTLTVSKTTTIASTDRCSKTNNEKEGSSTRAADSPIKEREVMEID